MSVKLTHNLSQRLVLTPQLRQRIEMLQMTSIELSDLIQQQLLENPVLEEVQNQDEKRELETQIIDQLSSGANDAAPFEATAPELNGASANGASDASASESPESSEQFAGETATAGEGETGEEFERSDETRDAFEEIDFGREFQEYLDPGYKTQEYEYKEDAPTFEQFLTRPPSLAEHLEWQLHMSHVSDELVAVAECVIGNLDGNGRLNATNEEIAALGNWTVEAVEEARQALLRLDPVGCGARDVRECLLVQLEVRGESERLATRLIRECPLSDLQQHKLPHLSKQLGVSVEDLVGELEHIRAARPVSRSSVFVGRADTDCARSLYRKNR